MLRHPASQPEMHSRFPFVLASGAVYEKRRHEEPKNLYRESSESWSDFCAIVGLRAIISRRPSSHRVDFSQRAELVVERRSKRRLKRRCGETLAGERGGNDIYSAARNAQSQWSAAQRNSPQ